MSNRESICVDIGNLTRTQLREKYAGEYNSWRNMKARRNSQGAVIDARFEDFADFLMQMGPRPSGNHTLDRIDPNDPEYSPEKCRWNTKTGQANNQRRTKTLIYRGETKTLTEWCRQFNLRADTVRRRYNQGGSAEYILFGNQSSKRISVPSNRYYSVTDKWPWLNEKNSEIWEKKYTEEHRHNQSRFEFFEAYVKSQIPYRLRKLNTFDYLLDAHEGKTEYTPEAHNLYHEFGMNWDEIYDDYSSTEDAVDLYNSLLEKIEAYKSEDGIFHTPTPRFKSKKQSR